MKKRAIMVAVGLMVVALGIGGYRLFNRRGETGENDRLVLYGNVDIRRVNLGFRVSGRIAEIPFEEGDLVRKGETVAVLDKTPYETELAMAAASRDAAAAELERLVNGTRPQEIVQARALIAERQASLKTLELEYNRLKPLVPGSVPEQTLDNVKARRDEARAQLQSVREALALALEGFRREDIDAARARRAEAEANLERAAIRLTDTELKAPSGGILLTRVEEPGAVVAAGQTIATLSLRDPVWVRAYVSEPDLGRIWPGMPAEILTDTRPDRPYRGRVGFISPEAEFTPKNVETPRLRTDLVYRLRVVADNPDEGLRQGMPVTVRLDTDAEPPSRGGGKMQP
ncbi:MAG: secretion protein HlyD [Desulfobacterales bacterium]